MAAETIPPEPARAPVSRYRSVRRAQAQQQQHFADVHQPPPVPAMPANVAPARQQQDAPISRSMSRYHRRPTASHAHPPQVPAIPSKTELVPALPANAPKTSSNVRTRAVSSPHHSARLGHSSPPQSNTTRTRAEAVPRAAKSVRRPPQTALDEARQVIDGEEERQRRMREQQRAEKRARLEAEERAERERQEQVRKEEEAKEAERVRAQIEEEERLRQQRDEHERGKRLQKAESAAHLKKREEESRRAQGPTPPTSPPRHGHGFGLFHRRRRENTVTSPPRPAESSPHRQANTGEPRDLENIRQGGGGAVLGIDAPISAVNAGDRRVLVACRRQQILLPVTPTTTALDLIKSAANCLTEPIDARTAVLLESFRKVGLTRPIRNYEHVRDVLNSWDDDKQNDLVIVDAHEDRINQDELLASRVSESKPGETGGYVQWSSRPHKWTKRYLRVDQEGQLSISKSETAKDRETICHLSDFDIYMPTQRKLEKSRPPKKFCYAVKSQQKSNIYVDESRYVHFFCTNDSIIGDRLYKAVQGWRSWYLKHVMGEGQKKVEAAKPMATAAMLNNALSAGAGPASLPAHGSSHTRGASVGSHYQLGTFSPLLDMAQFNENSKEEAYRPGSFPDDAPLARLDTRAMHQRKMSIRAKGAPPISYNLANAAPDNTNQNQNRRHSTTGSVDSGTFAAGGLLGRTYSKRRQAAEEREQNSAGAAAAFTEGPSLLNGNGFGNDGGLGRRSSVRSTHRRTSSDLQRSLSTRAKQKPLIDLTPQYKEPPQHARKGRAYRPEGGAGPLVESATSPEEAIQVPSAMDWRAGARPQTAKNHGTYGMGSYERTRSLKGRGEGLAAYTVNNHAGAPEDESAAFTGGLLAQARNFGGERPVGRGVMDGSKAKGPMLDVRDNAQFASGSLLDSVARKQGSTGPIIDRE